MKTTIKLIRNILEKFNLIANLTDKNLALRQQLADVNYFSCLTTIVFPVIH